MSKFIIEWAPYAGEYLGVDANKLPSRVTINEEVGSGGEAVIYSIRELPNALIKLYRISDSRELQSREGKVRAMIKAKPQEPTPGHITFAWPLGVVRDEYGRFRGFVMPYIRCAIPLSRLLDPGDYGWLNRFRECGVSDDRLRMIREGIYRFRVGVALNLVKAVGYVHVVGHFVGDLNDRNVLVNDSGFVTLIDTDSFFIRDPDTGVIYPSDVGVGEYTAPEVLRGLIPPDRRNEDTDVFSLSVIIFRLLMGGYHPFAGTVPTRESNTIEDNIRDCASPYFGTKRGIVKKPRGAPDLTSLPPELVTLFSKAFNCDRSKRPSVVDFMRVLERYYHDIGQGIH
ncbi:MAG: protein kinase domain-containing protein, partial [Vulcanisaeta sp.]